MGLGRGKPSSGDHSALAREIGSPLPGSWTLGWEPYPKGANPKGQPFGGGFPSNPPQMAPLILGLLGSARSTSWSLRYRFSPIYIDFLGRLFLVIVEVVFTLDYSYYIHVFFQKIVLRRNHLINRVVLFEEKSILVFPECLEASEW